MSLEIKIQYLRQRHTLVQLAGRLDGETSERLERTLMAHIADGRPDDAYTLDLEHLNYISSLGLRVVLKARKRIEAGGGQIFMANLQAPVAHVMEIANVLPSWSLFKDVEEADRYFDHQQEEARRKAELDGES